MFQILTQQHLRHLTPISCIFGQSLCYTRLWRQGKGRTRYYYGKKYEKKQNQNINKFQSLNHIFPSLIFRLKCTFCLPSFTNLRFWSLKFKNSTFGPLSFTPFANSWSPLILTQSKLTWRYFLMFLLMWILLKIN